MFNSFHLQSECCPNYIILIPSLSCFNRSVVSIIPLLTGVSSKCYNFASSYSLPSISNRSVVVIDPYRSLCISFYRSVCMYFLSIAILVFCLSTSKVLVMCLVPLLQRSVFQLCSSPFYYFLEVVQPLKVL